jgi:hypothetical protein
MTGTVGAYPPTATAGLTFPFAIDSDVVGDDGIAVDVASNGAARGRSFYSGRKHVFVLRHTKMTAAQKTDILDTYDVNRGRTFTLTFDGVGYTCIWTAAPKWTPVPGGYYDFELYCRQV